MRIISTAALIAVLAVACGGDGGALPGGPYKDLAAKCQTPRAGNDPVTGDAYTDKPGTLNDEKAWLLGWSDDVYLWYGELPKLDPARYATAVDWFDALKTPQVTASGKSKDQFHFVYDTPTWEALSLAGASAGYGANWEVVAATPPREVVVAYTDPGTPADDQSIARGAEVLTVDGVDMINSNTGAAVDTINAGLFPADAGESHAFTIRDRASGTVRSVTLVSAIVTGTPVQDVRTVAPGVGYLLFNAHVATAERQLIDAVTQLQGVTDLVLDLRYNGGGFLDIAAELAFMIAGPDRTSGKTFETIRFNDKHPTVDPVTAQTIAPVPFHSATLGFTSDVTSGQPLPHLDLARVFVLTGETTCSASEAIVNGLRGVGVQVVLVGDTTCGKPYGFYPQDNCGITYFTIEFQGVNDLGFGDYPDGFVPGGTGATGAPGCKVSDDFAHQLGDPAERQLAAALQFRQSETCPSGAFLEVEQPADRPHVVRPPWLSNRLYRAVRR